MFTLVLNIELPRGGAHEMHREYPAPPGSHYREREIVARALASLTEPLFPKKQKPPKKEKKQKPKKPKLSLKRKTG